jgi:hypothetical protein
MLHKFKFIYNHIGKKIEKSRASPVTKTKTVNSQINKPPPPVVKARVIPPKVYARAIYDREADGPTELSLESGDLILVETKNAEWWYGSKIEDFGAKKNDDKVGFFPGNYVELVNTNNVVINDTAAVTTNAVGGAEISSSFDSLSVNNAAGTRAHTNVTATVTNNVSLIMVSNT